MGKMMQENSMDNSDDDVMAIIRICLVTILLSGCFVVGVFVAIWEAVS